MTPDPLTPSPDTSAQDVIDRKLTEAGWTFHPSRDYPTDDNGYWMHPCDSGHWRTEAEALAMTDALRGTPSPDSPTPLVGEWRYNNGVLCCGTLRIAIESIDTNPSDEFKAELFGWIVNRLNDRENAALVKEREELIRDKEKFQRELKRALQTIDELNDQFIEDNI